MEWFSDNWFWLLIFIFSIWMHRPGHGCHGGHSHGEPHNQSREELKSKDPQHVHHH